RSCTGDCSGSRADRARGPRSDTAGSSDGMGTKPAETSVTPDRNDDYCRELEAYLCRKNDGHLVRIVGPSFERVCGWAAQGIPFKIACEGIDRYFVRYYSKGPKRRPVQIDFCDADVLEAFDTWRRSVGVRLPGAEP